LSCKMIRSLRTFKDCNYTFSEHIRTTPQIYFFLFIRFLEDVLERCNVVITDDSSSSSEIFWIFLFKFFCALNLSFGSPQILSWSHWITSINKHQSMQS
jgi:hypothetical protein